jgi:kumamolisin
MTDGSFVPLAGSERGPVAGAEPAGAVDGTERIEVTLITRRMAELPRTADGVPARISRDDLRQRYGSDEAEQALVAEVLASTFTGIEVVSRDAGARRMVLSGTITALSQVFGAELSLVSSPGPFEAPVTHRYRQGGLRIPAELDGILVAVLGLDDRPQAGAHVRRPAADAAEAVSYTALQVAAAYQFPAGTTSAGQPVDGSGENIGLIELGGGFSASDLSTYFGGLGLPTPTVTAAGVDGAENVPDQDPNGADGEVLLDIEMAGSIAPGAAQVVYFAPNTDQGFIDAVTTAVQATPTPTAVSISWGQSEDSWTAQARTSLDQAIADGVALGVTVCVAAGDNGSTDGVSDGSQHVDFPASSPHALACGGTTLQIDTQTGAVSAETVWNDADGATGGGVSDTFAQPAWQASAGVPALASGGTGRGVPDVAGNADPQTGYQVVIDGQSTVIGGTSAVAPLWAGLACLLAQATGQRFGLVQQALYAGISAGQPVAGLTDITSGDNGAYSAGPGWDACSGLGTPQGTALLARLEPSA